MCPWRVNNSYSTSGTTRDTLVNNPVISHELGKDGVVILTSEVAINDTDIPYQFLQSNGDVKQIVHNL
jgi:hypothetical protein